MLYVEYFEPVSVASVLQQDIRKYSCCHQRVPVSISTVLIYQHSPLIHAIFSEKRLQKLDRDHQNMNADLYPLQYFILHQDTDAFDTVVTLSISVVVSCPGFCLRELSVKTCSHLASAFAFFKC